MFKHNCQPKTFEKYLKINIQDPDKRKKFLDRYIESGNTGYTGAGLSAVNKLTDIQLQEIKGFLLKSFEVSDVNEAMSICADFDLLNIPKVRSGIYSPWLHYINPELFPLSNNSHISFRNWIEMPMDYPACIRDFNQLAEMVEEKDLGLIDKMAHLFDNDEPNGTNPPKGHTIHLPPDKSVFKISMSPAPDEVDDVTFQYCLKHKLIIMGGSTKAIGKSKTSQHEVFRHEMNIGDYFYLCRGNNGLVLIGQITGDVSNFELKSFKHKHWIQRPYKTILESDDKSTSYKKKQKHWTPNFNSTFIQIPDHEVEMANDLIFKPFFKTEFMLQVDPIPHPTHLNMILYGPPGTGKTYYTVNEALKIIDPSFLQSTTDRKVVKSRYEDLVKQGRIVFTTFHQSMSYEDFVEGIKPVEPGADDGVVSYRIEDGIFKRLCLKATEKVTASHFDKIWNDFTNRVIESGSFTLETPMHKKPFTVTINSRGNCYAQPTTEKGTQMVITKELVQKYLETQEAKDWASYTIPIADYLKKELNLTVQTVDNSTKPFVLIIDEINRGNVSQIFGELITLIEPDKRAGCDEALKVVLPYSKKPFSVPPNLHIIGTMNTADRSVEALDTALRRRFRFKEMMPDYSVPGMEKEINKVTLSDLLRTINHRIELLLDRDHQIGHSFLMNIKTTNELMEAFYHHIIPLLKEFFFGDFGKIGLVLGRGFVESIKENEKIFGPFDYDDLSQFTDKTLYHIIDYRDLEKGVKGFMEAIHLLMNHSDPSTDAQ